jgi:hypothetical protein
VSVDRSNYIGKPYSQVVAALKALGLTPHAIAGSAAATEDKVRTVGTLRPTGTLRLGTAVTVHYYKETRAPAAPTSAPYPSIGQPRLGNTDITISWPTYANCPPGTTLSGYSVSILGSASPSGDQYSTARFITLRTGAAGSASIAVKYMVYCGTRASGYSPTSTIPIGPYTVLSPSDRTAFEASIAAAALRFPGALLDRYRYLVLDAQNYLAAGGGSRETAYALARIAVKAYEANYYEGEYEADQVLINSLRMKIAQIVNSGNGPYAEPYRETLDAELQYQAQHAEWRDEAETEIAALRSTLA